MNGKPASLIDELLADARATHVPGQLLDPRLYERFKRKLQRIIDPAAPDYEPAHRKLMDAMEGR
jgi:hypothetical protein